MINKKITDVVKDILTYKKETRDSDFRLAFVYYKLVKPSFINNDVIALFSDWENRELPSMDTLSRARRAVQSEFPSLRGYKWLARQKQGTKKVKDRLLEIKHNYSVDTL
jgi:hypothetical protein